MTETGMGNASRHDGALSHIRICDLSGQLAGAGATRVLAAFGAQVIRIEDPVTKGLWDIVRQIGPYIGRKVVTVCEDRQPVSPIVEQPDRLVRLRAGPDEAPMLAGDFKAVAIGAGHDGRALPLLLRL